METDGFFQLLEKYSFEAKSHPCNLASNSKRNHLLLSQKYTAHRNPEWLASLAFEFQLAEYSRLVDDRKGVNNYAAATLELCSKLRKDCKGWKSSLTLGSKRNVEELFKENVEPCRGNSKEGCTAELPTEEELEKFGEFKPSTNLNFETQVQNVPVREEKGFAFGVPSNAPSFGNPAVPPKIPLVPHFDGRQPPKQPLARPQQHQNRIGPSSALNIGGFTGYPTGSGVYTSLVGGRFKKWGLRDKSVENDESNGEMFTGKSRSHHENVSDEFDAQPAVSTSFKTAGAQLKIETHKKHGGPTSYSGNPPEGSHNGGRSFVKGRNEDRGGYGNPSFGGGVSGNSSLFVGGSGGQGGFGNNAYHPIRSIKKSLGGKGVMNSRFVSPMMNNLEKRELEDPLPSNSQEEVDERLKNIEPRMIELIKNEIMDCGSKITWDDIAGLHFAKNTIQEIVVWPMLRPDIFTGLRRPPKGILLFGPPGTGKTLIGKCIASQSGSTFFSISASSMTSKWIGEGEKMVRALFAVARVHQPAVVFIDEIDSLLSQRSETEHESSRRIKTEFLVQLDGAGTDEEDRLLVIGATNRPQELDEAARRRLVKRLYIPLPDLEARKEMIVQLMKYERNDLAEEEIVELAHSTDGYSGADMKHLCQEACLGPIRSLGPSLISSIAASQVRPVSMADFTSALKRVHPSVGREDLHQYVAWNKTYGSGS